MTEHLLVSTRKGLFVLARDGAGWRIERHAFLGDNVTLAHADARDGAWYAALNLGHFGVKLNRSRDQGRSWEELPVPSYGSDDTISTGDGKPPKPASLGLIWALASGARSEPGRLWAGTNPGGLFRSDDHGASWQLVRGLWDRPERANWFGGGFDAPGIHSIAVDPRDPAALRVAVSCGGVWLTRDGGANWAVTADGMFAEFMPPERRFDPTIQDVHRMVQCPATPDTLWAQHHNAVFRSSDGGASWQNIEHVPPSVFGFAVAVHPRDPDTAWFVPAAKDQCRVPVDARLAVARTHDGGRSFTLLREGLPVDDCYDLVLRHGLAVDGSGDGLAMGSSTGGLWTSADGGGCWQLHPARLPPIHAVTFTDSL